MKRLSGFSLMEMMVVLLIVAIVAAASAPMISKKSMSAASEKSPWVWTKGQDIAYNLKGGEATAVIGGISKPYENNNPRLYIKSDNNHPQLTLGAGDGALNIFTKENSCIGIGVSSNVSTQNDVYPTGAIAMGSGAKIGGVHAIAIGGEYETKAVAKSIAIGSGALATSYSALTIGYNAKAESNGAIAIGSKIEGSTAQPGWASSNAVNPARAKGAHAIAIGTKSTVTKENSVAIGYDATAGGAASETVGKNSTAIGTGAKASHDSSTAIGASAATTASNQIVLGTASDTVYIPGNLRVDGDVELAVTSGKTIKLRAREAGNNQCKWFGQLALSGSGYNLWMDTNNSTSTLQSDRRLKNVGKAFTGGLEEIKKLEVFNYTFKKDPAKTSRVGVMAQDLQKIFPQAVFKGDDGFLRIRMEDMFYALVNAVKELDKRIEALKNNEILVLKKQVEELKKQNDDFEKRLKKLESKSK